MKVILKFMFKPEPVSKATYIFHFRIAEGSWLSWVILSMNLVVDIRKQNFATDREPSEARHKLTTHKALRGANTQPYNSFTIAITFIIQSHLFVTACPTRNNKLETNTESCMFFVKKKCSNPYFNKILLAIAKCLQGPYVCQSYLSFSMGVTVTL